MSRGRSVINCIDYIIRFNYQVFIHAYFIAVNLTHIFVIKDFRKRSVVDGTEVSLVFAEVYVAVMFIDYYVVDVVIFHFKLVERFMHRYLVQVQLVMVWLSKESVDEETFVKMAGMEMAVFHFYFVLDYYHKNDPLMLLVVRRVVLAQISNYQDIYGIIDIRCLDSKANDD